MNYERQEFYFKLAMIIFMIGTMLGIVIMAVASPPCHVVNNDEGSNFKVTDGLRVLAYFPTRKEAEQFVAQEPECRDE